MELYHSQGGYSFLKIDPYRSNLEEAIAQTALSNSQAKAVFVFMIVIT